MIRMSLTCLTKASSKPGSVPCRSEKMASHNNCRALVPADRQFSDEQIRLLIDRDAVIGVARDAVDVEARLADRAHATRRTDYDGIE